MNKRYLLFRILRSIVSIFLVTTITYVLIYTLVPRNTIFKEDSTYSKLKAHPDELANYENTAFDRMGYIEYLDSRDLVKEVRKEYKEATAKPSKENKSLYQKWAKENGWKLGIFPESGRYYATKDIPLLKRIWNFYSNLIVIDHPWKVKAPSNPDLKRYLKIEKDPMVGWALVGSGTQYKYQIYFNGQFPFIHQNIIHINLGTSYPTFSGQSVSDVLFGGQGQTVSEEITLADGKTMRSSANIYTRQYKDSNKISSREKAMYHDNYVQTKPNYKDPSMISISFRMGALAVVIAYLIGVPMAMVMARLKGKLPDKIGIALVTVMISAPSLAFVYFFRYLGNTLFGLPLSFPTYGAGDIKSYILPTFILGFLNVSGLVIWVRRYMIDQQSADYVKFAKSKGLTSKEISRRHIFKNAVIPIANGIPGSIILSIAGATITETIFAVPGMGKMLPDAILSHNNPLTVAIVFIFTVVGVLAVLLGDLLMVYLDPRIKLSGGD
ncbi:ABC transporter permease [Enterococcus cecorum]|uniref:ABC transporter permease n=1 Tax=Enterococcus cecorum TaxID=44008 RepID=UPI00148B9298